MCYFGFFFLTDLKAKEKFSALWNELLIDIVSVSFYILRKKIYLKKTRPYKEVMSTINMLLLLLKIFSEC